MPDDLAGKRTGERIQNLRERKGLSRPVLAGLVGKPASWLKGTEQGRRLPPRLPDLIKLAEALAVGDLTVLAGTDLNIGSDQALPVASFARIPHDAVPAIRDAVRDPMLTVTASPVSADALASRVAGAWVLWHTSPRHRTDVGRILPALLTDARTTARTTAGPERRASNALLADVYSLVQHVIVWASEAELTWTVADLAMTAAHDADTPAALASGAWTLGMVHRSAGDTDEALALADDALTVLAPHREHGSADLNGMAGALHLHAALTCARVGRDGDAWRYWDQASATAQRLPASYHHPWTMFGTANASLHAVSINADLSKSSTARSQAEHIDPDQIPSRDAADSASKSPAPTTSAATTPPLCTGSSTPTTPPPAPCTTHPQPARSPPTPPNTQDPSSAARPANSPPPSDCPSNHQAHTAPPPPSRAPHPRPQRHAPNVGTPRTRHTEATNDARAATSPRRRTADWDAGGRRPLQLTARTAQAPPPRHPALLARPVHHPRPRPATPTMTPASPLSY